MLEVQQFLLRRVLSGAEKYQPVIYRKVYGGKRLQFLFGTERLKNGFSS